MSTRRPSWQLPAGVTRGSWDYIQADHIAHDYDDYFAYNSLFEFDEQVLARHFTQPGLVSTWAAARAGRWCRWPGGGFAGWRSIYPPRCWR